MKIYMAPLEGITGHVFRTAYETCYPDVIDKYFTPFLAACINRSMSTKERNDILPEHNRNQKLIPQILTGNSEAFIKMTHELALYGYQEVNLNLGCPSQTVVSKGKGAALLDQPDELDRLLDGIFTHTQMKVSVKTRIGMRSEEEWERILAIYQDYPLTELIIHPRTREDYYRNHVYMDCYDKAQTECRHELCYNGDIFSVQDYRQVEQVFTEQTKAVMLGRGLVMTPWLPCALMRTTEKVEDRNDILCKLKQFHDLVLDGYCAQMCGDTNVLFKMKELWSFFYVNFKNGEKRKKEIGKTQNLRAYKSLVDLVFREENETE